MECIHDNGTEFSSEFLELLQSYGVKSVPTTVRNPQANAVLERVHPVISNMLCSQRLIANDYTTLSSRQQLLAPVVWAINSTYHTTLQASPAQLAFGRDMILPTAYIPNWNNIRQCRQALTDQANERENGPRIPHDYQVGDHVLIKRDLAKLGKLAKPTEGPFTITDVSSQNINGTVVIARSANSFERINIRRLVPYNSN
jgi:hypothetical protein